jgi:hypothetical protein
MRAFPDLKSREKMRDEFFEGELWKEELEHKLVPILEQYDVVVVDAKEASAIGGRPEPESTTSKRSWRSPFFNVVQVHPGLDVVAMLQSFPSFCRLQVSAGFIPPTAF